MRKNLGDWFAGLMIVAAIYLMARPGSKGADFITAITKLTAEVTSMAVDMA